MRTDKEKAVIAAAAECLRQAGDEAVTITCGRDCEVIVTRPGSQSSSVYTEDEFIEKYTPVAKMLVFGDPPPGEIRRQARVQEKQHMEALADAMLTAKAEGYRVWHHTTQPLVYVQRSGEDKRELTHHELLNMFHRPKPVNAVPTFADIAERSKGAPITSLTPSQDEDIATLRRRVRQLEGERDSIVMGASIKLATAHMTLQGLLNGGKLTGPEQMALQAVLDVLPEFRRYIKR